MKKEELVGLILSCKRSQGTELKKDLALTYRILFSFLSLWDHHLLSLSQEKEDLRREREELVNPRTLESTEEKRDSFLWNHLKEKKPRFIFKMSRKYLFC